MKVLENIAAALNFPPEILVIEYAFLTEAEELYACQLKMKGGEVSLERSGSYTSLADLCAEEAIKVPVLLLFSGKKVLSKRIDYSSEVSEEELAARAFPGVQRDNLIFQIHPLEGSEYSVSAIRKDIVEEILQAFESSGIEVLDIAVSPYSLWPLLKASALLNPKVGKYQVNVDSAEIQTLDDEEEVELFGQTIPSRFTAAFLYGLQAMADKSFKSEFAPLFYKRKEWKYGVLFKKGILIAASSFFILLLLNFLLFTHYQSRNAELGQLTQAYDQQFKEVSVLKKTFEEKNQFLQNNGAQNSRVGQMGDQIAAALPKQISLSEMSFQPVTRKLKKENLVRFSRNELQLMGTTENYESFQGWLNRIRGLEWIGDIEIVGYQEIDSRHKADFSIKVKLKE